jgi:hypothetical protein
MIEADRSKNRLAFPATARTFLASILLIDPPTSVVSADPSHDRL